MVHPVQSVIESLYAAGRCPRLHVNASHDNVVCPDFIREQWKERLIIDLDSSYPLDLTFGETGLSADLSFGGYVTRCEFPWEAIYIVADRATGRGIVLDRNMPESVRAMFQKARAETTKPRGPELRPVSAEDGPDGVADVVGAEGGGGDRSEPASEAPLAVAAAAEEPASETEEASDDAPVIAAKAETKSKSKAKSRAKAKANELETEDPAAKRAKDAKDAKDAEDTRAQKRRAAFRVIDGGG